jgi:hypothetical protein
MTTLKRPAKEEVIRMRFLDGLTARTGIVSELLGFFWASKWWWMTPMIVILMLIGGLIVFAQSSAIAPFIYTLF